MPKANMFVLSLCNHHFLLPVLIKNFQLHYPSIILQERILVPSNYLQLLQKLVLENCQNLKIFFCKGLQILEDCFQIFCIFLYKNYLPIPCLVIPTCFPTQWTSYTSFPCQQLHDQSLAAIWAQLLITSNRCYTTKDET